jgi:hypothetical protein
MVPLGLVFAGARCDSSADVLIANQFDILTSDSAHKLFVARAIGRRCPLVLIEFSDGFRQHLYVVCTAIGLQGFA